MADEPRRLSDFLRAHRERILSDWVDAVRVLEPAKDLDRPVLLDSLPQFLDELADFLDDVRAGHPAKEPVNPPTIHALDRLEVGYDLTEVVEEYAILRRCIVELVHDEGAPAMRSAQLARLHTGIDKAIVTSTARYHQASERTLRALERISSTALTYGEAEAMLPELLKVLSKPAPRSTPRRYCCSKARSCAYMPQSASVWKRPSARSSPWDIPSPAGWRRPAVRSRAGKPPAIRWSPANRSGAPGCAVTTECR